MSLINKEYCWRRNQPAYACLLTFYKKDMEVCAMAGSYIFLIVYWFCILILYTEGKDMEGSQIITLVVAMIGIIGTFVVDIRQSKKNTAGLKNAKFISPASRNSTYPA